MWNGDTQRASLVALSHSIFEVLEITSCSNAGISWKSWSFKVLKICCTNSFCVPSCGRKRVEALQGRELKCFELKENVSSRWAEAASNMTRNVHELRPGFREKKTAHRLKGVQIFPLVFQTVMSSTSIPRAYKVNKEKAGLEDLQPPSSSSRVAEPNLESSNALCNSM
jgi:hypothetical protein